jgi:hypothetical protein
MDRGRVIDKVQNENARFIDAFGANQKTSVRTTNPPGINILIIGGKSSFSLGWSAAEDTVPKVQKKQPQFTQKNEQPREETKTNFKVDNYLI